MSKRQIYDILKQEHEEVSELFHNIEGAKGAKATEMFAEVKLKLTAHSRGEEAVFYPRLLEERTVAEKVRESLEEHKQVDALLAELDEMSPKDDNWSAKMHVLADMVGHHVDEEEGELFPLARQALKPREAEELGVAFERERDKVMQELAGAEERGAAE